MIKYSIQNECLENIEAFDTSKFESEMALIESTIEILNKSIFMMELAGTDVDLPECPLFMESVFIQEAEEDDNNETDTADNTDSNDKQDSSNISEDERKAYNKENQFRQKNKKGKVEHILISILLFIPRLFGFIIQSIVKFFKKIFNKDTAEKAKTVANATDAERQSAIDSLGTSIVGGGEGENKERTPNGIIDLKDGNVKFYNGDAVEKATLAMVDALKKLSFEGSDILTKDHASICKEIEKKSYDFANAFKNRKNDVKQNFIDALNTTATYKADGIQDIQNQVTNSLRDLSNTATNLQKEYSKISNKLAQHIRSTIGVGNENNTQVINKTNRLLINPAKTLLDQLKSFTEAASNGMNDLAATFMRYSENINICYKAIRSIGNNKNPNILNNKTIKNNADDVEKISNNNNSQPQT